MAVTYLAPIKQTVGTSLADIGIPVPVGKVRSYNLRACNIGSADGYVDVFLVNTSDGTQSHYRAKNYRLPYQDLASAPDMEQGLVLTEGWKLQLRASAISTIECSLIGTEAAV